MRTAHAVWLSLIALGILNNVIWELRRPKIRRIYFNLLDAACQASSLATRIFGALSLSHLRTRLRWYDVYGIIDIGGRVVLVVGKVLVGRWAEGNESG